MIPEMMEVEAIRPEMEHEGMGPSAPLGADGSASMILN
jgi:hypothetical protein